MITCIHWSNQSKVLSPQEAISGFLHVRFSNIVDTKLENDPDEAQHINHFMLKLHSVNLKPLQKH